MTINDFSISKRTLAQMIRGLIGSICIEYRKIAIKKDTRSGRGAIKSAKRKIIARQCSMVDERRSRRWHTGRTEPINVVDAITSGARLIYRTTKRQIAIFFRDSLSTVTTNSMTDAPVIKGREAYKYFRYN